MAPVLVIDNYDSFTWNLVHLIGPLATAIEVVRNDEVGVADVRALAPEAVVISPGPGTPDEAGISLDVIRQAGPDLPILGICLGHQAIGQAYGAAVVRAPRPMHGKVDEVRHWGSTLFRGINGAFRATRYHSLAVDRATCSADLAVTADTPDGTVMGLSHRTHPVHGLQFHPESIASEYGSVLVRNFLHLAREWHERGRDKPRSAVH